MSLFYAYGKNIQDDWSWRYVITFATEEVADEWWIAVSGATGTNFPASVKRVTPQFYTHDASKANISASLTTAGVATQFIGLVFFTLMDDRGGRVQSIIPVQSVTDLISGNTFFIRSKVDPSLYWYCPDSTAADISTVGAHVYTSRTARTRFRVGIHDGQDSKGTVMIGSNDIYIALAFDDRYVVVNSGDSSLITGSAPEVYKFGDLKTAFIVKGSGDEVFRTEVRGEKWELV